MTTDEIRDRIPTIDAVERIPATARLILTFKNFPLAIKNTLGNEYKVHYRNIDSFPYALRLSPRSGGNACSPKRRLACCDGLYPVCS